MASKLKFNELECSNCGANIRFAPGSEIMICNYCGTGFSLEYNKIYTTEEEPVESIVPFLVSREKFLVLVKRWFTMGFFTRDDLINSASITKVTGIYLPFYAYRVEYRAGWKARSGFYRVKEQKKFNWRRLRSEKKNIHKINWKDTRGQIKGKSAFKETLVLGSARVKEIYRSFCESSSLNNIRDMDMAYISGFVLEPFKNNPGEVFDSIIRTRIEKKIEALVKKDVPGHIKRDIQWESSMEYEALPVYLPFWMTKYKYKSRTFDIIMSGESGKIMGSRPLDYIRIAFITGLYLPLVIVFALGNMFPYDASLFKLHVFGVTMSFWPAFGLAVLIVLIVTALMILYRSRKISKIRIDEA